MKKLLLSAMLAAFLLLSAACGGNTVTDTPDTRSADTKVADSVESADETVDSAAPDTTPDTVIETEADTLAHETAPTVLYTCTLDNGISVTLGGSAADALDALGDHTDMMEAPSCVHEGFDRVYTYGANYKITTSPAADGSEYVAQIELLSDLVAWEVNGVFLMIGSPASDVDTALGAPAEDTFGVRKYNLSGATVTVVVDADTVSGLTVAY